MNTIRDRLDRRPKKRRFVTLLNMKGKIYCTTIALLLFGSSSAAEVGSDYYVFQCSNNTHHSHFEALEHLFLIPEGFQVDEYNENSLVLVETKPSLAGPQLDVQVIVIRYGPIDKKYHEHWALASTRTALGLNFAVKTHTEEEPYGAQSFWTAFVSDDQQILIASMLPVDWRSFLRCMIS